LEARAIEPNAYLSPHFMLPAARYLNPDAGVQIFFVDRLAGGVRETTGVGVFQRVPATSLFPLPHLVAYRSKHSYLSGVLLDRAWATQSLAALLQHVRRTSPSCGGIEIPSTWADGQFSVTTAGCGAPHILPSRSRAVLPVAEAGEKLLERVSGQRMKDLNRRMRRLRERGAVAWRCHRIGGVPVEATEAFLALEHSGWKGKERSSLRSDAAEESFFREIVARFGAENRAVITELTLDGVAIASISHFISGNVGFGFKLGWNAEYKAYSPGLLVELEFIRQAPTTFPDLDYFDSGADAESYINEYWPSRRPLATVMVPIGPMARVTMNTTSAARSLVSQWRASRVHSMAIHAVRPELLSIANEGISAALML
jgi:CelD/BcsL family acetyltransferase involved in cellulose biosynthesis